MFGFLGFSYRPRVSKSSKDIDRNYMVYTAEISKENQHKIRESIKSSVNWRISTLKITDIANSLNSKLRGWINYFGLFGKRELRRTMIYLDYRLIRWLANKHKIGSRAAMNKLIIIRKENPSLFYHWQKGLTAVIK